MRRCKGIVITKSDGTVERFGPARLVGCLALALRGRAYDPRLSEPLARAITMHLSEWKGERPPTTDYVFRCVASVLEQTGLGDVAEDLARHRRLRAARRRRTRVVDPSRPRLPGMPWCKSHLVGSLENEYGVRHSVARFLAGQIEAQVFALGYRVISKPFLAELVRNEALAWGLADDRVLRAAATAGEQSATPTQRKEET